MMTNMGVILIGGLKHCGKSSLGKVIAEDLNYRFFDLDDLMLQAASGVWASVREIWKSLGKAEFLRLEEDAARNFVEWIIPSLKGRGIVLSLGGGTVENPGAIGWLKNRGLNVYVRADADLLFSRVMAGGRPPFLSEGNPRGDFMKLYARRDPLYEAFADLIHDVDDSPIKINAQRLLVKLEKHHAG